ncbi:MAG TPA: 50S ribosomal protein L17 [Thermoanaerobaculia bacterium]|nr:50S ribosomal protein L17 [Thermoanaerobaculia bacterium]
MQHNRFGRKLRRSTSHRLAMFRNQLMSMVEHERIATTLEKAKELRPLVERVVSMGKNDSVPARRKVFRWVPSRPLVKKVFDTLGPRFTDRPGGYTRILHLGRRRGDNSEEAILEFVDFKFTPKERGPKRESTMERARRSVSSKVETIRKEKEAESAEAAAAEGSPSEKPKPKRKPAAKAKPAKAAKPAAKASKPAKEGKSKGGSTTKKGNRGQ